jgi:hypothetical protein
MKKVFVGVAVAAAVGYLAILGVGTAQAWSGDAQTCSGDCQAGPRAGWADGAPRIGILSDYEDILDNALAKVLNLSTREIRAARDSGTTWAELAGCPPGDDQPGSDRRRHHARAGGRAVVAPGSRARFRLPGNHRANAPRRHAGPVRWQGGALGAPLNPSERSHGPVPPRNRPFLDP